MNYLIKSIEETLETCFRLVYLVEILSHFQGVIRDCEQLSPIEELPWTDERLVYTQTHRIRD